jgi:hypothetical protein
VSLANKYFAISAYAGLVINTPINTPIKVVNAKPTNLLVPNNNIGTTLLQVMLLQQQIL